jgi:hypothetical protein
VIETKQTIIKLIFYLKTLVEVYYREIFVRLEEAIKITRKRKTTDSINGDVKLNTFSFIIKTSNPMNGTNILHQRRGVQGASSKYHTITR